MKILCFDKFATPMKPASWVNHRAFSLFNVSGVRSVSIGYEITAVVFKDVGDMSARQYSGYWKRHGVKKRFPSPRPTLRHQILSE
jgi:hypothetical protein